MGAIRFQCDVCQAAIVVDASEVGSTTSCPNCRRTLTVPALSPTSSTQSTGELPPASQGLPAMTPQAALDLPPIEGFEIIQKLGAGGMGAVYKARQTSLNRFVALKVMSHALARDPEFIDRFKREAATAAQFKHPNIVQVHAAGECSGIHYMAMEFVEGRSLRDHIRSHGRLEPQEAIAITLHVAEGLKYAWNKSRMIHRDIKPDNIFLSTAGEVLVGDMGLAKNLGGSSTEMTSTGMMLGSPHYISPEQAMATKDIDFRADIYSLGCTLYHMLTGRTAYEGDSSMALMLKHVHDPPPDIFEALPECPRKLGVMVTRMMAKNRDDRPPNYEELIAGLWEASESLSGETEIGRPPAAGPLPPTAVGHVAVVPTVAAVPPKRVSPAMIYGVVGGVIALLLVGLFLWSPWNSRTDEQGRREDAKTGSESRLQAESVSGLPAKAGTPNATPSIDEAAWQNAINLLPLIDPAKDAIEGEWLLENSALRHKILRVEQASGRLQIPYQPPEEYDFRIVFTSQKGRNSVWEILRGGGRTFQLAIAGVKKGNSARCLGFEYINGKTAGENPSSVLLIPDLEAGSQHTSLVQVRRDGVKSFLDGRLMTEWKTDYQDMTLPRSRALRDDQLLGIADSADSVFHRIEVREVTGKGTFTRGAPSEISTTPPLQHSISPAASSSAALSLLGSVFTNSVGAEMVYIPPGEFMMGSTKEEQVWALANGATEQLVKREGVAPRKAAIKRGFWMGRTETTVGQWKRFVIETGYVTDGEKKGESVVPGEGGKSYAPKRAVSWRNPDFGFDLRDDHPVTCISWNDATAFCRWLTVRERKAGRLPQGHVVRLPTEVEWEYACRAGTQTKFWWGDSEEGGNGRLNWVEKRKTNAFVVPVDSFGLLGRNGFGLADMLGNVWEWCFDEDDETRAHEEMWTGNLNRHPLRGGSFRDSSYANRCAGRSSGSPVTSRNFFGFRICYGVDVAGGSRAKDLPTSAPKQAGILAPPETRVTVLTTNPKVGEVYTLPLGGNVTMELMGIPPGEFMQGSTKEEREWAMANGVIKVEAEWEGEAPRKARMKRGFWMGRTEVTVGQWKQFVAATGYITDGEKNGASLTTQGSNQSWTLVRGANWKNPGFGFNVGDNNAVCCISWNDAVAFCKWLDTQERNRGRILTGFKVRLPTEAEWEYACRAGTQSKFWWGDSWEDAKNRLNWRGDAGSRGFAASVDNYGSRGRNGFGLADMLGNVWEWCLDGFDSKQAHEEYYQRDTYGRPLRGGAFNYGPGECRCARRGNPKSDSSRSSNGFRICYGVDLSTSATGTSPTVGLNGAGILAPPETRVAALTTTPKVGEVYTLPLGSNVTMDLMGIPPGEFMLGSTKEEKAWAVDVTHTEAIIKFESDAPCKVTIKDGFWMGRTEVTVGQWKQFVNETGYVTDGERKGESLAPEPGKDGPLSKKGVNWRNPGFGSEILDSYPVCCISWNDAMAFCEWLNTREQGAGRVLQGYRIRLPRDSEWEYACRARTNGRFWWGDTKEDGLGRLNWQGAADGFELVAPVDSFGARGRNCFGLADMLGNLYEWCLEEYAPSSARRIARGGSFNGGPSFCRCAYRNANPESAHSAILNGFRICVAPAVENNSKVENSRAPSKTKDAGILAPPETRVTVLTTNPKVGEVYTLPLGSNVTMELMGIPPGEFMLGSTKEEQAWAIAQGRNAKHVEIEGAAPRKASIKQGFWLARTAVTVSQWKEFVAATGYKTDAEKRGYVNFTHSPQKPWEEKVKARVGGCRGLISKTTILCAA